MRCLVTGVTGQDGAWLAKMLIDKGHEVFGAVRRGSTPKQGRLEFLGIYDNIRLVDLDVTEFANVSRVLRDIRPKLVFNLAAQSFVHDSFDHPKATSVVNYDAVLNFLEAIRLDGIDCSFYQASTSEMFGITAERTLNEKTPFNPVSPYAISKLAAHQTTKLYREAYKIRCCSGILFNHESELRGKEFVTRKITHKLAQIKLGDTTPLLLGNLDSQRDWGYAPDYVEAMMLMATASTMDDYVVATNKLSSVREFLISSAEELGFDPVFEGEGSNETCIDRKTGLILARTDEKFFRPVDVTYLKGDYDKINKALGWKPKTFWGEIASKMASADFQRVSNNY